MRRPWLRFALLGGLLFALDPRPSPRAAPLPPVAALGDDALLVREALLRGYERTDDVVRRRLIQNLRFARPDDARSEDELVSEAIRLGMHESDLVVQRRLALKMRLLLAEPAREREPSEAELESYLAAHAERFTEPARVTLRSPRSQREARSLPSSATRCRCRASCRRTRRPSWPRGSGPPSPQPYGRDRTGAGSARFRRATGSTSWRSGRARPHSSLRSRACAPPCARRCSPSEPTRRCAKASPR